MKKQCSRCRLPKPLGDFHRNKRQVDGHQVWCKVCVKEYQNQKRSENREAYRTYQRAWFARHPGYFRNYSRNPTTPPGPLVVFEED